MSSIYTERLDADSHAIRTITLLPGSWTSMIRCILKISTINDASYNAISYAWGEPDDKASIIVQDTKIAISSNLEEALRHLRKSEEPVELWIDSICINQRDNEEKARQVGMMGEIYRRSKLTYIWLGTPGACNEGKPHHEQVDPFALIRAFAEDRHLFELPFFNAKPSSSEDISRSLSQVEASDMWDAFQDAAHRPWWSRFWCVQECLLSPASLVVLGYWKVAWSTVKLCEINYRRHLLGCCSSAAGEMPNKYTFYADQSVVNTCLDPLRSVRVRPELSLSLDLLVRSFRNKSCQDPRDKVYGILGLADKSTKSRIVVDYTASTSSVYTNLTEALLTNDLGSLRCLTGLGFNPSKHGLPSWVRNLDARPEIAALSYELTRFDLYNLYDASMSGKAAASVQDSTLCVNGVYVDKIWQIGRAVDSRAWPHVIEVLSTWLDMAEIHIPSIASRESVSQGKEKSFCRAIVGDVLHDWKQSPRRLTQDDTQGLVSWIGSLINRGDRSLGADPPMNSWIWSMFPSIYGRAMFITRRGHIGMCYPSSSIGDEIWVLHGGKVPFVLSEGGRHEQEITARHRSRVFVRDCYLDGFMDGEAIRESSHSQEILMLL